MYNTVQERESFYRVNGLDAIHILIYPEPGSNQLKCSGQVREEITKIAKLLPSNYQLFLSDDKTRFVEEELSRIFWRTFFTLLILLIFLVLINNKGPYLFTIFLSLIINICISFLLYRLFNIEIHLYSLAGITISLGMMIDNSIIMTDHIFFRKNIRVFPAILASTLTSIASLLLIELLPESIKLKLQDFMMVIVINLLVSLFVALFFVPPLASQFGYFSSGRKRRRFSRLRRVYRFKIFYQKRIAWAVRRKKLVFLLILLSFGIPTFLLPGRISDKNPLSKVYNHSIGSDWYARNLMPYADLLLGGSFRLFYEHVLKKSTNSRLEKTELQLSTRFPVTYSMDQMNDIIRDLEKHLENYRGIDKYISQVNPGGEARVSISFKRKFENSSYPYLLKNKLISRFISGPAMNWKVYGLGRGFNQQSGSDESSRLGLRLRGYKLEKLDQIADHVREKLALHPRIKHVWYDDEQGSGTDRKEETSYEILPQRDLLLMHDLSASLLYQQLNRRDLQAEHTFRLIEEGDLKSIILHAKSNSPPDMWNIMHKASDLLNGTTAKHYLSIRERQPYPAVRKINQHYIKDLQFDYLGGIKYGYEFREKTIREVREELPVGYSIEALDFSFLKKDPMQFYLILIIILLIFTICSILFESFIQPLAIILSIPVSFMGVFISFYLFKLNFDQGGYAALVLLGGLSVNASIYIINDFNNFCKTPAFSGRNRLSLYLKAFQSKIVPVLLTLASTILGLLPFLSMGKGEAFWFAFAAATSSGLLFTLLAVVFVLPLILLKSKDLSG
ncbi:MAG: efflux RND transporter permease subunit [Bacteroidota bacterium]|nr:efflux RND transporter permease subunit [Bacteroidota bacterium]